jgi:hypothetical protein
MDNPLIRVHQFILQHYSLGELRTLCFALRVNPDDLPGQALSDKTRELILRMGRTRGLSS